MVIYTMGFTQKSAEKFFGKILDNKIQLLIDVRLNNKSQLAGFSKGNDLEYFLKMICNCKYVHESFYAPTEKILSDYKKEIISWNRYEEEFTKLLDTRKVADNFQRRFRKYDRVLLLCSEPTPEQCHRRLVAERLQRDLGYNIEHL